MEKAAALQSSANTNMSGVFSSVSRNGHATQSSGSISRQIPFHASTPVQSPIAICSQSKKKNSQNKPGSLSQENISPLLVKIPTDKEKLSKPMNQTGPAEQVTSFELVKEQGLQVTSSANEQNIAFSINKVKQEEESSKTKVTVVGNITSSDHQEPTKSSQLISEDSLASSKHLLSLYDDFEDDNIYKSPFSEPPRRSYARVRPVKRLTLDEDDEVGEEEQRPAKRNKTSKKRKKPRRRSGVSPFDRLALEEDKENVSLREEKRGPAKRNKTAKKSKEVMQTTLLDQWAKELSSHFAEVEGTDLITE